MKKIFITGASSFLGRRVIKKFTDYEFTSLTNVNDISLSNVTNIKINNYDELKSIFKKENFEYVFHFASQRHVQDDIVDIQKYIDVNLILGTKLFEASNNSSVKTFVYSGSLWQDLFNPADNLYTISKQHFEDYLEYISHEASFKVLALRIGDLYGKDDFRNKLIPYIKKNEDMKNINFNSNGEHLLSPVHIDDVISAIEAKIFQNPLIPFERVRLCSKPLTIKEFVGIYKITREKNFNAIYGNLINDSLTKKDFKQRVNENIWKNEIDILDGLKNL